MTLRDEHSRDVERSLRFLEFRLIPEDHALHPADRRIAAHPALTREHVLNIELLPDETVSVLYQLRGDISVARSVIESEDDILEHSLNPTGDSVHAYVHVTASEPLVELLRIPRRMNLIPDLPFEYASAGGLRICVVGDFEAIREGVAAVPEVFRVEPERIGRYDPTDRRLFDQLTERQQETLRAAVELGYYRHVRQATYKDIAEAIDRTDGTVGDHLRKVEELVMREIVP